MAFPRDMITFSRASGAPTPLLTLAPAPASPRCPPCPPCRPPWRRGVDCGKIRVSSCLWLGVKIGKHHEQHDPPRLSRLSTDKNWESLMSHEEFPWNWIWKCVGCGLLVENTTACRSQVHLGCEVVSSQPLTPWHVHQINPVSHR